MSPQPKAAHSRLPSSAPPEPARSQAKLIGRIPMLPRLIVAVVLSIAAMQFPATEKYAGWIFLLAVIVVFVIEGVRIVPQQHAWVVERLGKFHTVLEPGLNLIIPFM